jgi:hypothetical protein
MSALSISSISRTGRTGEVEGLPELALLDVVLDVLDPLVAELAVAQAGDGVVFVEALVGLGRRLDVPGDQRRVQHGLGHLVGQHGLAGAGLALDQQGRCRATEALTATFRSSVATGGRGDRPGGDDHPGEIGALLLESAGRGIEPVGRRFIVGASCRQIDDAGRAPVQGGEVMDRIGQIARGIAARHEKLTGDIRVARRPIGPQQRLNNIRGSLGSDGLRQHQSHATPRIQPVTPVPDAKRAPVTERPLYMVVVNSRCTSTKNLPNHFKDMARSTDWR